jgi:hypothetical protein
MTFLMEIGSQRAPFSASGAHPFADLFAIGSPGLPFRPPGLHFGHPGTPRGPFWTPRAPFWRPLGPFGSHSGRPWRPLGPLGTLWLPFGAPLAPLGTLCAPAASLLLPLWDPLASVWLHFSSLRSLLTHFTGILCCSLFSDYF